VRRRRLCGCGACFNFAESQRLRCGMVLGGGAVCFTSYVRIWFLSSRAEGGWGVRRRRRVGQREIYSVMERGSVAIRGKGGGEIVGLEVGQWMRGGCWGGLYFLCGW